jgi:lipopolysaccharide biosynthesis protein
MIADHETQQNIRAIAFYLPQFHPTPENNAWWGKGFTEWTNVAKTTPRFDGHYQPHISADLGFYDLRLPEVRQAQADLARSYGIHGFCYYHYWFSGRRLLQLPLDEILKTGEPNFPFCLCWANEDWTRNWDGNSKSILIKQEYSEADDCAHMEWLVSVFKDQRYIRVNGKPLFLIYRSNKLPSAQKTTEIWRKTARQLGIGEIFLCRVESFPDERGNPEEMGFDAAVEFQPDWGNLGTPLTSIREIKQSIFDYRKFVQRQLNKTPVSYTRYPCVTPSWDNSPRRMAGAITLFGSTPCTYREWLACAINNVSTNPEAERIVFINAWNEWAEGNHLEPDLRWGHSYLRATLDALSGNCIRTPDKLNEIDLTEEIRMPVVINQMESISDAEMIFRIASQAAAMFTKHMELASFDRPTKDLAEIGVAIDSICKFAINLKQAADREFLHAGKPDEVVAAEQKLLIAEDELERIRSSVSWNITKPLRAIYNVLTGKIF